MKVFAAIAVLLFAAVALAEDMMMPPMLGSSYGAAPAAAPSYAPTSIPSPPCPRNYLFSCQPSLQPAPCSQPAPSYGSAGAYSANVPTYIAAPYTGLQGGDWLNGGYQQSVQGIQGVQGVHYQ